MNYEKYKQEERDFNRYWNQHDVVAEEERTDRQTKQMKRICYWAKKVQDKYDEYLYELIRKFYRISPHRCLDDFTIIDDEFGEVYFYHEEIGVFEVKHFLSWPEYRHLTEELKAIGMTVEELEDCIPYLSLVCPGFYYGLGSYQSNSRLRKNKNKYWCEGFSEVFSSKDLKFLKQLIHKVKERGFDPWMFDDIYRKPRTSRISESLASYYYKRDASWYMNRFRQHLSKEEEHQVIADTDFMPETNRKIEKDLIESLPIPPGSIIEIYNTSFPSKLRWEKRPYEEDSDYCPFPFRPIWDADGKIDKMKCFSKILLHSFRRRLPTAQFDFAPEGVIIDLWTKRTLQGFGCKIFIPYERLRDSLKELYNLKAVYYTWFAFVSSIRMYQSYYLISKEAKKYLSPYDVHGPDSPIFERLWDLWD